MAKAIIISEKEWEKSKKLFMELPGKFCNPVINHLEQFMREIPEIKKEQK